MIRLTAAMGASEKTSLMLDGEDLSHAPADGALRNSRACAKTMAGVTRRRRAATSRRRGATR
jgi:hypothetical protein